MNVLHIEVERKVEPDTLTYHLCRSLDISWITTSIYDKEIRCKIFTHTCFCYRVDQWRCYFSKNLVLSQV